MKVLFWTPDYQETFECDISNLLQLVDYCKVNKPELYSKLVNNSYSYTVHQENMKKAYPILPDMSRCNIEQFDSLVIAPKITGNIGLIAGALIAAGVSTIAAYAIAIVIVIGLIVALGYIMQALTPNKKLTGEIDPAEASRLFNGVPNITEQGGSVPIVTGNCLFGGVRIGLKFEPTLQVYTDVTVVADFEAAMAYPSTWLKLA